MRTDRFDLKKVHLQVALESGYRVTTSGRISARRVGRRSNAWAEEAFRIRRRTAELILARHSAIKPGVENGRKMTQFLQSPDIRRNMYPILFAMSQPRAYHGILTHVGGATVSPSLCRQPREQQTTLCPVAKRNRNSCASSATPRDER